MKQVGVSVLAMILCLIGFRILSPASADPVYHIAYLVARNADFEDEILKPENLFKGSLHTIDIAYSWADLLRSQAKKPLDALVIHESAVPMIDFEWVANAYWHGLTISTANIQPTMIAHLFDNGCLPYGYEMPVPEEGGYMTIGTQTILSLHDQNQVVNWIRRDWRRNCDRPKPPEVKKPTCVPALYTSGPIMGGESLQWFLTDHIQSAHEQRERFIEENKGSVTPQMSIESQDQLEGLQLIRNDCV